MSGGITCGANRYILAKTHSCCIFGGCMSMNDEMEKYLRHRRKGSFSFGQESWWNKVFTPQKPALTTDISSVEEAQLEILEKEIKQGEERLSGAATPEEEQQLAAMQE